LFDRGFCHSFILFLACGNAISHNETVRKNISKKILQFSNGSVEMTAGRGIKVHCPASSSVPLDKVE